MGQVIAHLCTKDQDKKQISCYYIKIKNQKVGIIDVNSYFKFQ